MAIGKLRWNEKKKRYGMIMAKRWRIPAYEAGDPILFLGENQEWNFSTMEYSKVEGWHINFTSIRGEELDGLAVRQLT